MATTWHPILNAIEGPVGTWSMIGPVGETYATITLVRRGDELGYRVIAHPARDERAVISYNGNLLAAARAGHSWFTSTRGPSGVPYIGWGGKQQT